MTDETKELPKQLGLYADAITGFATVQLVGFVFLMTHGDCFTKNVVDSRWYAIGIGVIVNVMYLALVYFCHRGEDQVFGLTYTRNQDVDPIVRGVQAIRYTIIALDGIVTMLLPLAINYGFNHHQFHVDCRC